MLMMIAVSWTLLAIASASLETVGQSVSATEQDSNTRQLEAATLLNAIERGDR
jgi:hypothetical protein